MSSLSQNEHKMIYTIFALIFLGVIAFYGARIKLTGLQDEFRNVQKSQAALATFFDAHDSAEAIYIFDATDNKVLFERNSEKVLPLASLAKLAAALTAYMVFDQDAKIQISANSLRASGDNGLRDGELWPRDELIDLMLVASSNDAAYALRDTYEGDFIEAMNSRAKVLDLENTSFSDPAGLDHASGPGAVGSASDMAKLILDFVETMPSAAQKTILPHATFQNTDGRSVKVSNTNDLSASIGTLMASKTGYTRLAGGNLAIVYRMPVYGHVIAMVVLGSTKEGRFVDIDAYMNVVEQYFKISQS